MECLNHLARHVNECEVRREKYALPGVIKSAANEPQESYTYPALRGPPTFAEPRLRPWAFMKEDEVADLMQRRNLESARNCLDKYLSHGYPKALPRMIAVELLYGGYKFAKITQYSILQTGALLSMLYLTHQFFTSCHRTTAEDVYFYFKELVCYHSLEFSPSHQMIFNPHEASVLLSYFCKIFLRHLPIIRLLGLPNFEFAINTYIPPPPEESGKKEKKSTKASKATKAEKGKKKKK